MNIIILSKNYSGNSSYYHQDIIDSFKKLCTAYLYGDGYGDYDRNDSIADVINKSPFDNNNIDLIVCSTSWDEDTSKVQVDPHPNINLSKIVNIPKVYFLNKEYKKLDLRFEYIKKQKFNLVCTVHPDAKKWEEQLGVEFLLLPFGISLDRFKYFGLEKKYDFTFTGGLHKAHTDLRFNVKQQLFDNNYIDRMSTFGLDSLFSSNPIKKEYQKYNIRWAQWGAKNFLYKNLLPTGLQYVKMMNKSKVFLNTPSAIGIFNTRFFELMATKSLILCPVSNQYMGMLKDGYNCVMFKDDMSDFDEKLKKCIDDDVFRNIIVDNAYLNVEKHSYDSRIHTLINHIKGSLC